MTIARGREGAAQAHPTPLAARCREAASRAGRRALRTTAAPNGSLDLEAALQRARDSDARSPTPSYRRALNEAGIGPPPPSRTRRGRE